MREAYHGPPYATQVLLPECFNAEDSAKIDPKLLLERLPSALNASATRYKDDIDAVSMSCNSLIDFVGLYVKLFREDRNPTITASY